MLKIISVLFFLLSIFCFTNAAKILGIFYMASPSHYILGNAYLMGLANAGHDVTMVSPFKNKVLPKNGSYRDVELTGAIEYHAHIMKTTNIASKNASSLGIFNMTNILLEMVNNTLNHPNFKKLLKSKEKFDVIVIEPFACEPLYGLIDKFQAPLILFSTIGPNSMVNSYVGIPTFPSYIPQLMLGYPPKMTFYQRVVNTVVTVLFDLWNIHNHISKEQIYRHHFPDGSDYNHLLYNISFVFFNSHPSINQAVPNVPNAIEIAGFHIQPPKKLPTDLQTFLDDAKEGVVYFSLGSNAKSNNLEIETRMAFIKAFEKLKLKVLWKWEDDELPNKPPNVKISKWLPQSDILAHPNIKLFMTHGGLLSTTETIDRGVPILAIPIFGDQHQNAKLAEIGGFGRVLPLKEVTEEKLTPLINELLENPKYRENVKMRSKLYHDRPMKPMDALIYWTEYVIRHKGAPHLRVAGVDLYWYQYMLIDVLAFLLGITVLFVYILKKLFTCAIHLCCKKNQEKITFDKTNKKNK